MELDLMAVSHAPGSMAADHILDLLGKEVRHRSPDSPGRIDFA